MAGAWLDALDDETRTKAESLIRLLERAGAPDAELWVRSEIGEDFAQVATFLFLKSIWVEAIDRSREYITWLQRPQSSSETASPALERLLATGASLEDLGAVVQYAVECAMFRALVVLDNGEFDEDVGEETPGWALIETDANGDPTGRGINGTHESLDGVREARR